MKDIKDYLHLYLGNAIAVAEERFNSPGLKMIGLCDLGVQCRDEAIKLSWYVSPKDTKLILRPLSDMTEEEAKELDAEGSKGWKIVAGDNDTHSPKFSLHHAVLSRQSHEVKYLLSKGFDLFNLIPEGLGIDKTTLKQ